MRGLPNLKLLSCLNKLGRRLFSKLSELLVKLPFIESSPLKNHDYSRMKEDELEPIYIINEVYNIEKDR